MAVVQVAFAPNREMYDQIGKLIDIENNRPDGLILHTANELPDGRVQIVDVYESAEALTAFGDSTVIPAFMRSGHAEKLMAQGRPEYFEAFELLA